MLDYSRTLGKNIEPHELTALIQKFVALRILRDKDEAGRYEMRHDALAAKVFEKITVFEKDLLEIRQFIENAHASYEKRGVLLSVADLKYIGQYEDKIFLGGALLEFVNKSKEDIKQKTKVLNRITAICIAVLMVLFVLVAIYFIKEDNYNTAKNNAIEAVFQLDDPAEGFVMALGSYNRHNTSIAQAAIFSCFYRLAGNDKKRTGKDPFLSVFNFTPCNKNILFADFSADGKTIYGFTAGQVIYCWDISGKVKVKINVTEVPVLLKMSPDSKFIAAVMPSGTAMLWKSDGGFMAGFPVSFDDHNTKDIISFAPGKMLMAAISNDLKVMVYSLETGKIFQEITGHHADVTAVCFSPDERFLATSSKDKTVKIWYFNRIKNEFDEYSTISEHRDIVWSVQFNSGSDYVLTASADSSVKIFRLTGENHPFIDNNQQEYCLSQWTPLCRAEFSKVPVAMLLTRYCTSNSLGKDSVIYWITPSLSVGFVEFYERDTTINGFDFCPVTELAFQALTRFGDTTTTLVSTIQKKYFHIINFSGVQPRFSPDGRLLLTISGNRLNLFPVSFETMDSLIFEKKIFGNFNKQNYSGPY